MNEIELDKLVRQAHQKLDRDDFEGAKNDYRAALLAGALNKYPHLLDFLDSAEEYDPWTFNSKLLAIYPDSLSVRLREARFSLGAAPQWGRLALKLWSELFEEFKDHPTRNIIVRQGRHGAALKAKTYDTLLEDTLFIWNRIITVFSDGKGRAKQAFLKQLAKINDPKLVWLFETLALDEQFSPTVRMFFTSKAHELKMLCQAIEDEIDTGN